MRNEVFHLPYPTLSLPIFLYFIPKIDLKKIQKPFSNGSNGFLGCREGNLKESSVLVVGIGQQCANLYSSRTSANNISYSQNHQDYSHFCLVFYHFVLDPVFYNQP